MDEEEKQKTLDRSRVFYGKTWIEIEGMSGYFYCKEDCIKRWKTLASNGSWKYWSDKGACIRYYWKNHCLTANSDLPIFEDKATLNNEPNAE